MGYLKSTGTVFIYVGLFLGLVTFLPGIPPDAQFTEYSISAPPGSAGGLVSNNRLDDAEILFKGEFKGPESFASYNGELYTSLHGGDVVKIVGKHIVPIVKFGKPCSEFWMEKECGRPLGLQFDNNGKLYVSDPYNGIFKVDVTSGKYERIVDISKPIEGAVPKLANSLDIATNGDIYWSDSTRDFCLQDGVYACLANPSGRLIKYDAVTKRNTVLLDNLNFANGVKLSRDESFVVVVETLASRLMKFNLKGDKAGRAETFVQGLPGVPDNIHTDGEDGFLVTMLIVADADHPVLVHTLAPHPYIRKMLARLLYLLEAPFKLIEDIYPNYYSKRAVHWIGHFESIQSLGSESVIILRIDADGKIIDSASSFDGKISSISSAYILKDYIYLGSPYNDYLGRVLLARAFPTIKGKAEKVVVKREVNEATKSSTGSKPSTTPPPVASGTIKPKLVTVTPKPAHATPQQPSTAVPTTTRPPPQQQQQKQQQQQQQQGTPKATESTKQKSPEPVRQVPAPSSPPPPPSPTHKVPVKEASPAQQGGQRQPDAKKIPNTDQQASRQIPSKPPLNEHVASSAQPTNDGAKKPTQNQNNAQKPPPPPPSNAQKPLPSSNTQKPPPPTNAQKAATANNVKGTEVKGREESVKISGTTPPPLRN